MTGMPRILYITNGDVFNPLDGGGLKRSIVATGLAAVSELFMVLKSEVSTNGWTDVTLPTGGSASSRNGFRCVNETVREIRPDAIIVDHSLYYRSLNSVSRSLPIVVNTQNVESLLAWEHRRMGGPSQWIRAGISSAAMWQSETRALRGASQVWFVSSEDEAQSRRVHRFPGRSYLVPNVAPNWAISKGISTGESRRAVFLGSLNYWPNQLAIRELANVSRELTRRDETHNIDIVGSGQPGRATEGLPNEITVRGFVEHLRPCLETYGFLIAPMTAGGGSKTKVLEAMAAGRAVLTTPKGIQGLPGMIDGVNVIVRPLGPSFVEAASLLLRDPALAHRVGTAALCTIRSSYNLANSNQAIATALSALLSDKLATVCNNTHSLDEHDAEQTRVGGDHVPSP